MRLSQQRPEIASSRKWQISGGDSSSAVFYGTGTRNPHPIPRIHLLQGGWALHCMGSAPHGSAKYTNRTHWHPMQDLLLAKLRDCDDDYEAEGLPTSETNSLHASSSQAASAQLTSGQWVSFGSGPFEVHAEGHNTYVCVCFCRKVSTKDFREAAQSQLARLQDSMSLLPNCSQNMGL